jgi:murein DD-endopeptidase MepM/ murein hydrolase activator NlpD
MNRKVLSIIGALSVVILAFIIGKYSDTIKSGLLSSIANSGSSTIALHKDSIQKPALKPVYMYGMNLTGFNLVTHSVQKNELFPDILSKYNVAASVVNYLITESKSVFNLNKIRAGNNCTVVMEQTASGMKPKKLIYEQDKINFVVFNLEDSAYLYCGQNKVERKHMEVGGKIESSLYETLENSNIPSSLAVRMADIFSCAIDFYRLQKGDYFKIIYDEDFVEGESVGVGEIQACIFNSGGKDNYAFYYEKDKAHEGEYYDERGESMKRQFLKAPLKFFRISSKFAGRRFHPVTKVWKAHLGTDYAASYGTPIMATADGIIEDAMFKVYNGNYVKIRHNGQYKTQYLHMSKIAKGIKRGTRVSQGQVIGYVGSTGLATGPHVCYRFWKDGQQVDPFKQKGAISEPLPAKYKNQYLNQIANLKNALDRINITEKRSETALSESSANISRKAK